MLPSMFKLLLCGLASLLATYPGCARSVGHAKISPKVMITTLFTPERNAWLSNRTELLAQNITVPGLSPLFPQVHCDKHGQVCIWATGEGQINAAASTMSLVLSDRFDFDKTYFYITGIAGGDPRSSALGDAVFAKYAIQVSQQYALDAREIPSNWTFSFWNYGTPSPNIYPTSTYGTEVFALNFNLAEKVHKISKEAAELSLNDSAKAQTIRKRYNYEPASGLPQITLGDVATSDLYFTGKILTEQFGNLTKVLTNNTGTMVTSAQEDNAVLESLLRGHLAGLIDYSRIIVMRTVSDYLYAPPGMSQYEGFESGSEGSGPAFANLYIAGNPIVDAITKNWGHWKHGVAHQKGFYGEIFGSLKAASA